MRTLGALCVIASWTAGTALAADRVDTSTVLSVDLSRRMITDVRKKEDTGLLPANRFTIRRNETVTIQIMQQNPLLFLYEARNEKSDTDEFKAAVDFARQLQVFLGLFPGAAKGANIAKPTVLGLDPVKFQADLEAVLSLVEALPSDLAASVGTQQQITDLKDRYSKANVDALAARIDKAYEATLAILRACLRTGSLQTSEGQAIRCDGPVALADNIAITEAAVAAERLDAALADTRKQLADANAKAIKAPKNEDLKKTVEALKRKEAEQESELKAANATRNSISGLTLIDFVQDARLLKSDIDDSLATLKSVAKDVALLNTSLELIVVQQSVQRQTVTIKVKPSSKYEKLLDAVTRKTRTDTLTEFDVVLEPHQPAHITPAPAFVIGFVRNPEFTVAKNGETFVIRRTEQSLTRYTVAAMINITPDSWQEPTFGGHFQLGITPIKDQFGFYFGGGIRAQRVFTFGGGLMVQQVRRLAGGLTLDSRLNDPADLKTDTEFRPGLYLHITAELPK